MHQIYYYIFIPDNILQLDLIYHLNSTDELFLLHVDMCNIQPDVAKFCRRLAHLSEYISGFIYASFMREHRTDAIRSPNILRIGS